MTKIIYAGNCGECEYVLYSSSEKNGFCDRFEDSNFVYGVSLRDGMCLYETPGKRISLEEMEVKKEKAKLKEKEFRESLREAREKISKWPEWKRNFGKVLLSRI